MKAQHIYLEHANITVSDLQESIRFFQTAFPHFKIRGRGNDMREWIHIGDNVTYIAINQAKQIDLKANQNYDKIGVNHLGFVVQDVEEIAKNLLSNGYKRDFPKQIEQFRVRDYFADQDGNQYEFVQYLSELVQEKNNYAN
ncbi:VOC family protein [Muriicola sp. Z0-33]|uniref:VOC family protein n=1 Tax=Muriicola sp. Z0-33 TaxID=2816957 RepID=UPI002238C02D|nr:VOC family protein [Muriicola sp. Z0-33]MCW5516947.1 VOC family protein [Muriicola sp. Z0-33]